MRYVIILYTMLTFYLKYVIVDRRQVSRIRHTQLNYVLLKMNIEILNSIHGGVVLSIYNYLYIKNKDYIRKIDDKHIFYWTCVKQCGAKIRTFCENNVHYIV